MNQIHLVVMCVSFVWSALSNYATTPQGMSELADIEAVLAVIENPGQTSTPTETSASTPSAGASRIIRK